MELTATAAHLYESPLFELLFEAHSTHRIFHAGGGIQRCFLVSIKTGGCPEDCGYCGQSAHYEPGRKRQPMISVEDVRSAAIKAKKAGADRLCLGAAWRSPPGGEQFERVLEMVREVKSQGLEACATLGMLTGEQAAALKKAGLDAYNHNLDTSREHYSNIVTTRTYDDRIETIRRVREAGMTVCCGGILGLGESVQDRCRMLAKIASFDPQPESVPINLLMPIPGTPLEDASPVDPVDLIRTVAVARLLMPRSRIRLSAGRVFLSRETQILAFFAGANSIFVGEKLLTAANPALTDDEALLACLR